MDMRIHFHTNPIHFQSLELGKSMCLALVVSLGIGSNELVWLPCSQVWFSGIRNLFKISEMGHLYKDCYPLSPGITELDIHTKRCYYQKLQI